jgi:hypothetical protein
MSEDNSELKNIIAAGNKRAQEASEATMVEVRSAIGLGYS